ncbi:hypoxia-inducible factor 1-alpha-like [Centruroides sculpturatus]|uniref:hypoxia-inducible factor 1-alpha-like n=1 Tax=Centruroides sculpturatus TaxID=218467 RepID=UPI000C6D6500|nr:hypoxia-inducible factor 1-alpha-like [Centruroides sculpturatus]
MSFITIKFNFGCFFFIIKCKNKNLEQNISNIDLFSHFLINILSTENSEKRKEKSRDAARCRRGKETEIFFQLADQLPLPRDISSQLDKASIMRLAIGYLKIWHLLDPSRSSTTAKKSVSPLDCYFAKALEGFLIVLSEEGDMVYLSESVNHYLGLTQIDLMGHSIFDFTHPCDHDEIREMLCIKSDAEQKLPIPRSFFVRMKCTLTNKGRNVNLKSATYKVIHCTGHVVGNNVPVQAEEKKIQDNNNLTYNLVTIGEPIPHPSNIEVPLDRQTFLSRHNLDMKFTYVDERISNFLGYNKDELLGKSVYSYYHALDIAVLEKNYKILFSKGQCETEYYRFLAKHGGYVWILTQATLIYENNSSKPQCVVCVNYVLSGTVNKDEIVSTEQVKCQEQKVTVQPTTNVSSGPQISTKSIFAPRTADMNKGFLTFIDDKSGLTVSDFSGTVNKDEIVSTEQVKCQEQKVTVQPTTNVSSGPQISTKSIFAPRTADMNKGFLTFIDDKSGLTVFLIFPDMLNDVLFSEAYGDCKLTPDYGLLSDDPCFSVGSNNSSNLSSPLTNDPFLSYREDSLSSPDSCGTSSDLSLSKSGSITDLQSSKSNTPDLPSLESPVDRFANLDLKLDSSAIISSGKNDLSLGDDFDMHMRGTYMSMSSDDFPLLSPSNSVMWGPQDSPSSSPIRHSLNHSPIRMEDSHLLSNSLPSTIAKSSLAALLQSDVRKERTNHSVSEKQKYNEKNNRWHQVSSDKGGGKPGNKNNTNNYLPVRRGFESGGRIVVLDDRPNRKDLPVNRHYNKNSDAGRQQNGVTTNGDSLHSRSIKSLSMTSQKSVNGTSKLPTHGTGIATGPIEQKQPFPSPPDPPPKRSNCNLSGPPDSPKRMRIESGLFRPGGQITLKDSVLLNLLINGEDASNGYHCSGNRYEMKSSFSSGNQSVNVSKKSNTFQNQTIQTTTRLTNGEENAVPSLLYISQQDAEVNAPIQPSYLLQGEELLKALDQTMKDVTAIV